ncbi:MAG: hypothetical protein EA412_13930 [Chitinophagaceae bacterium]|nr:MAG: hypothetical protein EA412_13930 [Chitinophagaceae bacterium]
MTVYVQKLRFHPYKIFVYGLIAGLTFMFLSLSVSFLYANFQFQYPDLKLPVVIHINTLIIIFSSISLWYAEKKLNNEDILRLRNAVGITFGLGVCFIFLQYSGLSILTEAGLGLRGSQSGSYFYLISGLHVFHVLIGLVFLLGALAQSNACVKNDVKALVFLTDPVKKMSFKLMAFYWHFVGLLWIYLYIIFILATIV